MEAGFDLEDDLFYADLNKQISLLIMDDDEHHQDSLAQYPSLHLQALAQTIHPANQVAFMNYDQQPCKRESKGTGVFIPRSLHSRRKSSKQGKSRASGNRGERPSEQLHTGALTHMAYYANNINNNNNNNNLVPSYQSANYRSY